MRWIKVTCRFCRKVHCEATPGSKVRFRCKGCKTYQIMEL